MSKSHIALAAVAVILVVAAPAVAGKGGNGNGNGNESSGGGNGAASTTSAWLSITPNDAPAWSRVWGSGCGYQARAEVYIDVQKPNALMFTSAVADSAGCISFTFTTDDPGTYSISARQQLNNGGHWTEMATYNLPVV